MNRRRFALVLLFALVCAAFICSCSVKGKNALVSYAKYEYGSCEYIKQEVEGEGNSQVRTVYLRDNDTGIEYEVTSRLTSTNIDGSNFGYTERTSSNFSDLYWDYVIDKAQSDLDDIADEYDADLSNLPYVMLNNRSSNGEAEAVATDVFNVIKKYDVKDILKPAISVYSEDEDIYMGVLDGDADNWIGNDPYKVVDFVQSVFPDAEFTYNIYGTPESYVYYDDMQKLRAHGCNDSNSFNTEFFFFDDPEYGTLVAFDMEAIGMDGVFIAKYKGYGPGDTVYCEVLGIT